LGTLDLIIGIWLGALVGGILVFLLWMRGYKAKREAKGDELVLEYGKGWKAFVIINMVWFPILILIVMTVLSRGFRDLEAIEEFTGESRRLIVLVSLLLATFAMPVGVEVWGIRHRMTPIGIKKHSPWSRDFHVTWEEVDSITWREGFNGFRVGTKLGVLWLPMLLHGLRDFADAVVEKVPEFKWATVRGRILKLKSKQVELGRLKRE